MKIQTNSQIKPDTNLTDPTSKSLYLLDGHAILYRYHFAFKDNPMRTSTGQETSATWGMAKIVATLLLNYPISHIAVIFDPPCRTWRKEFYSDYKASRKDTDDISPQIEMTYHMLKTWGIFTAAYRPLEADDVIGILAKEAAKQEFQVFIVTRDKDFMQLVCGQIKLLDLGKQIGKDKVTIIDKEAVYEHYKVLPEQIVDYLTIIGDTSDNIPGILGIGKKTAAELLDKYGTLDKIYENLDKLTKSRKEKFLKGKKTVLRDKKLVTLATDYRLPIELESIKKPNLNNTNLLELFEKLEFYSIIKMMAD